MAKGIGSYVRKEWYSAVMAEPCCFYCGLEIGQFHCDHITPPQKGGQPCRDNLLKACHYCNSSKSDKLLSEWLTHCVRKRNEIYEKTIAYIHRGHWQKKRKNIDLLNWLIGKIRIGRKEHSLWTRRISSITYLTNAYNLIDVEHGA